MQLEGQDVLLCMSCLVLRQGRAIPSVGYFEIKLELHYKNAITR